MQKDDKKFHVHKADRLISKQRFNSLKPELLLKEAGLKSGMHVADIGCGNGFFGIPAAELVAPQGIVFALDISEEMLTKLRERDLPQNIRILLSEEQKFPVETDSIDFVILSAVIHEAEDRNKFLFEVRRILKENASLWILEWIPKEEENGPPQNHRVSEEELKTELNTSGFQIDWTKLLGESHYQILSKKISIVRGCEGM